MTIPHRWRALHALVLPLLLLSALSWVPALVAWATGGSTARVNGWVFLPLLGLVWGVPYALQSAPGPAGPDRVPHRAALGLGVGTGLFVAVTRAFRPAPLFTTFPTFLPTPATVTLGGWWAWRPRRACMPGGPSGRAGGPRWGRQRARP